MSKPSSRLPVATIAEALEDARLLGAALQPHETWRVWTIVLKAAFALPLDDAEREVFRTVAGDRAPPSKRVRELWCIVGRGGGKSRMAAALGDFLALFQKHRLSAGERRNNRARPRADRQKGSLLIIRAAWFLPPPTGHFASKSQPCLCLWSTGGFWANPCGTRQSAIYGGEGSAEG
jgi:hypothetical protein